MVDDLAAELKVEQETDDKKKEYCAVEFDKSEDKSKVLTKSTVDFESVIAESEKGITMTKAKIEAVSDGIKALEQGMEENEDYTALKAGNGAAKELLAFAKSA